MAFQLNEIVPWGRSFDEYVAMFSLSESDLGRRILGCGDGPASFNAVLTRRGGRAVSVDPLYAFSPAAIRHRIDRTFATVLRETRNNKDEFIWENIRSVDELGRVRMAAMNDFLADFPQGKSAGRYVPEAMPALSFADASFDLALCSHLLFLYSEQLDLDFHIRAITELCRLSPEVRVFPLLQLGTVPSPHVPPVCEHFRGLGYTVDQVQVPYRFQRGADRMLRITGQP